MGCNQWQINDGASYPFGIDYAGKRRYRYPNILQLIGWPQNAKPYPFDLRILYLRRPIKACTLSIIRRASRESAQHRLELLEQTLSIVQTELLLIDSRFWFAIDTVRFFGEPLLSQNRAIIMKLFDGYSNQKDIHRALSGPVSLKRKLENYEHSNLLNQAQMQILQRVIDSVSIRWPLLVTEQVLVKTQSNQNTMF